LELAVFSACVYEAGALAINRRQRVPPISHVCWRHPSLIPVIVGGLTVHLLSPLLRIRRAGR
jgi:hypothetical protein